MALLSRHERDVGARWSDVPLACNQAVEVTHLRKTYGTTVAIDDVSFSVEHGEIFGILGRIGQLFLYPSLFFAGLWTPQQVMASWLLDISKWTPTGASVHALQTAMQGTFPPAQSLFVLGAYAVVFGVLAVRFFRWE